VTSLALAATAFQWIAAGVSIRATKVRPELVPVRNFLVLMTGAHLVRLAGLSWFIEPYQAAHPGEALQGVARAAGAVEASLFLSWYAGLIALALVVFRGLSWKPVAALWALVSIVLAVTYPWSRGAVLGRFYAAGELAALAIGLGCGIEWAWRRERPGPHHSATIALLLLEVAVLVGPFRLDLYQSWERAQIAYIAAYCAVTAILGGASWKRELPSS
jgi:hypothetical protein